MKHIAIIGTQGVPANYGGFESLVENIIGENKSPDIEYTVFCSSKDMQPHIKEHKGARLKYVPLSANGAQSVPYDILSLFRLPKGTDVILILGVSGSLILPFFRLFSKKKIIINIDGLEHRRDKWGKRARAFLKFSEKLAVKYADVIVADNKGIQDYVKEEYNKESALIAYGGDHVIREIDAGFEKEVLDRFSLSANDYAITVCRIEPENNCHNTLEAFSRTDKKLIFIGNWNRSEYGRNLKEKYSKFPNITIQDPIYDIDVLYALRKNAGLYIHGHSAGGTNPSLVEAMFFGRPILCYDVVYNRATTQEKSYYWANVDELVALLKRNDLSGKEMIEIAQKEYTWKNITSQYEALY
jgi:glycosyltransferase involved in cell wall biosynthesis